MQVQVEGRVQFVCTRPRNRCARVSAASVDNNLRECSVEMVLRVLSIVQCYDVKGSDSSDT